MAITTIDNLQEIQSAGENDVLPISTGNGVKKIKASNLGGGGGAEDFVVEFTFNPDDDWATTANKTFAQAHAAYQQGKNLKGKGTMPNFLDGDVILHNCYASDTTVTFFSIIGEGVVVIVAGTTEGWTTTVLQ